MRLYTRSGDEGETSLFGGARVAKTHARLACYGELDELNSLLGWCGVAASTEAAATRLLDLQSQLFTLGSWLATPADAEPGVLDRLPAWPSDAVTAMEQDIDAWQEQAPELTAFILPGGCEFAARLQLARSVCRRVERSLVGLAEAGESLPEGALIFLNRLSDWLFALARLANHESGETEIPWRPDPGSE